MSCSVMPLPWKNSGYLSKVGILSITTVRRGFSKTKASHSQTPTIHIPYPYSSPNLHLQYILLPDLCGLLETQPVFAVESHTPTRRLPTGESNPSPRMASSSAAAASLLKRQLKEMQTGKDIPGISCGLVNDTNIFEWEVMLMINDDCKYYGGMVYLLRCCDELVELVELCSFVCRGAL